ncbi:fumarase class II [Idiomarina fontislapidosi]|uniref:Fumarate hydratase class II n=1 Tax=Idiomarina fontislapidosi TaxID=263723 RepID=A0A432YBA8_9GAMM|nr:class II fumarate hydratase [Idiomarina fontislapidosi]PYE35357.1 fumarase class II [Idiomarina fontislapidosi]RUO58244.1 aspartate ammonia-lyase [Idiomarina fontislapidosi]
MSRETRIETDSMGQVEVPKNALYGAQTQRAVNNFPISGLTLPTDLIKAIARIKWSAAAANQQCADLDADKSSAIKAAAQQIIEGQHADQFPIDVFQTGSGTSSNMNVNEVIAHIAQQQGVDVHPNDDVNRSQSSNDTIPTAIQIASVMSVEQQLQPALKHLIDTIRNKAVELRDVVKTGRTHLMDAMPLTMAQELNAWAGQLELTAQQLPQLCEHSRVLPQGGTAIGTGINAPDKFADLFAQSLSEQTGLAFKASRNPFTGIAGQELNVQLHGQLNTLATTLLKVSNDLRWMNSGPLAGLGEIQLTPLQPGSSIMPGKVNPVIPEAVAMVAAQINGNHTTITTAAQQGNFQLNVMLPVIGYNLMQSIELLTQSCQVLADKAIAGFEVNHDNLEKALAKNPILVTALNPVIGYSKAAEIAKRAYKEKRPIIDVADEMTDMSREELSKLLNPKDLTQSD